jgi:hypothetical protein
MTRTIVVLSRFDAAALIAFTATKETSYVKWSCFFGQLRIPTYPPTCSDNIRPVVPGYPPTFDALP